MVWNIDLESLRGALSSDFEKAKVTSVYQELGLVRAVAGERSEKEVLEQWFSEISIKSAELSYFENKCEREE